MTAWPTFRYFTPICTVTTSKFTAKLLLLSHSENYIKLNFVVVSNKIFLARLFCAPLPAAPGGNCPPLPPLCYATGYILAAKARIDNRKKLVKQQYPPRPHNVVNFSPLTAEIGSLVWGTPANFNGYRVLASLLQRRCSAEANQTLHDVWPYPGLVRHVYAFSAALAL